MKNRLIFLIAFITLNGLYSQKDRVFLHNQIKPIIWGCDTIKASNKLLDFSEKSKEPHPLDIGRYLFYSTYQYQLTKDDRFKEMSMGYLKLINDLFIDPVYFNTNSFKYNYGHDNLKAGWWSGMANASIMLGLTYADKVYL